MTDCVGKVYNAIANSVLIVMNDSSSNNQCGWKKEAKT